MTNKFTLIKWMAITMVALPSLLFAQNKSIKISGTVKFDEPNQKMEIYKYENNQKVVISQFDIDKNGSFSYSMKVEKPGEYVLDCKKWESVSFWAEDEDIHVNFRGRDTAKILIKNPPFRLIEKSGPKNEVMNQLNFLGFANYQGMIALGKLNYQSKFVDEESKQTAATAGYDFLNSDYKLRLNLLADLYHDRTSAIAILARLNPERDAEKFNLIINSLKSKYPNYPPLTALLEKIKIDKENSERVKIGAIAPEFSFPTPEGKKLSPSSFRGKILLIDFWASWCGPCRAEIPNLKEAYAKYKDQGVEFLSVSVDKGEKEWLPALKAEEMPWPQVLAPKAGSDLMVQYQFSGIPFIILIDREGHIVAKNLRGAALSKAIEQELAK